jgi:hypothetical protein
MYNIFAIKSKKANRCGLELGPEPHHFDAALELQKDAALVLAPTHLLRLLLCKIYILSFFAIVTN